MIESSISKRGHQADKNMAQKNQWWKPVKEALAGLRLNGIRVACPRCHQWGMVATRWVKGPSLKPVYVLHNRGKTIKRICKLHSEEYQTVRDQLSMPKSDVKKIITSKRSFVLFSGGIDSLGTLMYLKELAEEVNRDLTAVYVDTTAGLSENKKYVRKVCRYLDVKLEIVSPKTDYFTLVKRWGIPSHGYRWCCRELKIKPIADFLRRIKEPKAVFDGIRAQESNTRRQYVPIWYHPSFKCLSVSAIFYWTRDRVLSYVNGNGLPKTFLHSMSSSTECWCGAYKSKSDFEKLYELDREMFNRLADVERENKGRFTFIYEKGQKVPLRKLAKDLEKAS